MTTSKLLTAIKSDTDTKKIFEKLEICLVDCNTHAWITEGIWKKFDISEPYGDSWKNLIHHDDKNQVEANYKRLLDGESEIVNDCYRIRMKNRKWCWIIEKKWLRVPEKKGESCILVGIAENITEIKAAQVTAEKNANTWATLNNIIKGVNSSLNLDETVNNILTHIKKQIPFDRGLVQILRKGFLVPLGGMGYPNAREWQHQNIAYPDEKSLCTRAIQERKPWTTGDIVTEFPENPLTQGENNFCSWLGIPLIANGSVIGHIALFKKKANTYTDHHMEIAEAFANPIAIALENARLHDSTYRQAMEDSLTKIGTRHAFNMQSHFYAEKAKRDNSTITLAMLDLDHFKRINDDFGHLAGDKVLQNICMKIKELLRGTDLIARYGGEEIIILFPDTNVPVAESIVGRICQEVSLLKHQNVVRSVTLSAGISGFIPGHEKTINDTIKEADEALYQAKAAGRNRIIVFNRKRPGSGK